MTGARVLRGLRRLRRDGRGASTIEFVILFPAFVAVLLAGIESGAVLTRKVMLERALDIAVRDLRLGRIANPTHELLRQRICARTAVVHDCEGSLLLELRVVNETTWNLPTQNSPCIDRSETIAPLVTFNTGAANQIMLVRACLLIDPMFPTTPYGLGLPLDASGAYALRTASAFVNEPR